MIDAVPRIDHDALAGCVEEEYGPPAGRLDADELQVRCKRYGLDVRIEPGAAGLFQGPPCLFDALEHRFRVLAAVHQFLGNMVDVTEEREEERVPGVSHDPAEGLGETEVEDRVIEVLSTRIVLEDFHAVPGLQLVEKPRDLPLLLEVEADGKGVGGAPPVVEIDPGDVGLVCSRIPEEVVERPGGVGHMDRELEETLRFQGSLQVSQFPESAGDLFPGPAAGRHFEKNRAGVDPFIELDPVDVPPVPRYDVDCRVECTRPVRYPCDEGIFLHVHGWGHHSAGMRGSFNAGTSQLPSGGAAGTSIAFHLLVAEHQ